MELPSKIQLKDGMLCIWGDVPSKKNMYEIRWHLDSQPTKPRLYFSKHKGKRYIPFVGNSKQSLEYSKLVQLLINTVREDVKKQIFSLPKPLRLGYVVIKPRRSRWDYHNIIQATADALVESKVLKDDDSDTVKFIPLGKIIGPPRIIFVSMNNKEYLEVELSLLNRIKNTFRL